MNKIDAFYSKETFFSLRRLSEEDLIFCLLMIITAECGAAAKALFLMCSMLRTAAFILPKRPTAIPPWDRGCF